MNTATTFVDDVTCLGCGCACDDIRVGVRDDRIVSAERACALGVHWFGDGRVPARSLVDGRNVSLDDALATAVARLLGAARPLVYLAPGVSCEAQRQAAAVADLLQARLDSVTSATALAFVLSAQERGLAAATLGEIRNRADVVLFWAVDVERRYPRFTSRYAPAPVGTHVPGGRAGRQVIAVDVGDATSTSDADRRFTVAPDDEISTLAAVQALVRAPSGSALELRSTDTPTWAHARALAPLLLSGRYVAVVYDAEPDDRARRSAQRFDALAGLSHALNDRTRCAGIALRGGGNRSGADSVLTAQAGFPLAVDFARGYPRYEPHSGSASSSLQRGAVDLLLVIGDASLLPATMQDAIAAVPRIAVGPRASAATLGSALVVIDTGVAGIHGGGTAFRTDDVPLPLRAPLAGGPSAESVVRSLARAIASSRRAERGQPAMAP